MRDLKAKNAKANKVRNNRRKREKKAVNWRKLLHRSFRISLFAGSFVLVSVGGFFLFQLVMSSDLFRVDRISVQGGQHLGERQVVALSDIQFGVNTFNLDLALIGEQLEANPWIRQARVSRIFPRQVAIELEERQPVAIINLGLLYYLDDQGEVFKVLDANDELDYPMITGFEYERAQGHDPEYADRLKQIVALIDNLGQRDRLGLKQISEIHHEENGNLTLFTLENAVEIRLGRGQFSDKLDRLEKIYVQLKPQFKVLDYIDLNVNEKIIVRIERPRTAARS